MHSPRCQKEDMSNIHPLLYLICQVQHSIIISVNQYYHLPCYHYEKDNTNICILPLPNLIPTAYHTLYKGSNADNRVTQIVPVTFFY